MTDNIDTEAHSPNGQKSTHGIAIIETQAQHNQHEAINEMLSMLTICQLKWESELRNVTVQ